MRVSIRGLVAAARWAEAQMRDGIPEAGRDRFLETVGQRIQEAWSILQLNGAGREALPAPSRRALQSLERIAAQPPETLPVPTEGARAIPPVRVNHVVKALTQCQNLLSEGACEGEDGAEDIARWMAADAVSDIAAACQRAGSQPAGLPPKSRTAYAMLAWLAEEGNAERYVTQARTALASLRDGLLKADPSAPLPVEVTFTPGRTLWRGKRVEGGSAWRLSAGFLAADAEDFERMAWMARWRHQAPESVRAQHEAFVESEPFRSVLLEIDWLVEQETYRPRGRAWHLDDLYQRLDETLLEGSVPRPSLHWWSTLSKTSFGFYLPSRDLVCISTRLDDPTVPEFVAEFVLFHELLHKKHPIRYENGRRLIHTPAFRAEERRHPRWAQADVWIDALVRGERPPTPRATSQGGDRS